MPEGSETKPPRMRGAFLAQLREAAKERGVERDVEVRLGPAALAAWRSTDPSAWADETALVEGLRAARPIVAESDEEWMALLREHSRRAIQRFYRLFLRYLTPRLLLSSMPSMWSFTHTTGHVTVEAIRERTLHVAFREHPPLAARVYQDLTVAVLEALLELNRSRATVKRLAAEEPPETAFVVEVSW